MAKVDADELRKRGVVPVDKEQIRRSDGEVPEDAPTNEDGSTPAQSALTAAGVEVVAESSNPINARPDQPVFPGAVAAPIKELIVVEDDPEEPSVGEVPTDAGEGAQENAGEGEGQSEPAQAARRARR